MLDINLCCFIINKVMCFSYVADTVWFSLQQKYIHKILDKLCEIYMDFEKEDNVASFLKVHLECQGKLIKMTQKELTRHIINTFEVWNLRTN